MTETYDYWLNLAQQVLDIEIEGLTEVKQGLDLSFCKALEEMAHCKGRIIISGIGKSGLIGRKIAATLSSTGSPSFFLHPVEGAHGDMGMLSKDDVVLTISNSGETDELNAIIPSFKALGVKVISITSNLKSTMARLSDLIIQVKVPREACMLGLAPTASTTATLAVGDALAVCLMENKHFKPKDFKKFHPGGFLGQRLQKNILEIMHTFNLPISFMDNSLGNSLEILNKGGFGVVFIVDKDNRLSGVITDGDVRRLVCSDRLDLKKQVKDFMNADPLAVKPDSSAGAVLDMMEENAVTVLPIIDSSSEVLGIIHLHDLLGKGRYKFSDHAGE
ncbi:MAG: KpsF/GutQ family sugar-phosphate isomerase [Desulfonatronovibrio sp. MSAO_Bac4]|nr:MAG: KpsF/GutQ family sugar-phosphate isomerase [Desulfonatronovibrio sp. MSAO_Bac4]